MEMSPITSSYPLNVALIAVITAVILIFLIRALIMLGNKTIAIVNRIFPRRFSFILGSLIAVIFVATLVNNVLVQTTLNIVNNSFAAIDKLQDEGVSQPLFEANSGSSNSLIAWDDIGRRGKSFLTNGPNQAEIAEFTGRPALQPVRIFAGYDTGENFEERAEIAVKDLIRAKGFERSVLVVATATGTGWLDTSFVQPLAFLHQGDVSIISMQYSYVPSFISLLVDPDRSRRAARVLFNEVFKYWTKLPKDSRPELYLFGLSLGALGSEASVDFVTMLSDPIDGALWSGPPFPSTVWQDVTKNRNANSAYWRPEVGDGSIMRFMNQDGFSPAKTADWGPIRIVYLQYASDPIVFFSPELALNRPDWLKKGTECGRDVSPYFNWYLFVTFLQVAFDIPLTDSATLGYAHNYSQEDYIDAWLEVAQPKGWNAEDTERLKRHFANLNASSR